MYRVYSCLQLCQVCTAVYQFVLSCRKAAAFDNRALGRSLLIVCVALWLDVTCAVYAGYFASFAAHQITKFKQNFVFRSACNDYFFVVI